MSWFIPDPWSSMGNECPGSSSEMAGKADACAGCPNQSTCASGETRQPDPSIPLIAGNLAGVRHRILILSGKGGVGKSTICAALAQHFTSQLHQATGVLDVDLCGPSQARMMGCPDGSRLHQSSTGLSPVFTESGTAVVSIAFLLDSDDTAVIWRGDKKTGMIRQLLRDVDFGDLDVLFVDTPPGTSDEHLALVQLFRPCSAILVTTPQEIAWQDVRKEIDFCRKTDIPLIGVVENMAGGVRCANCGEINADLFASAGVREYCDQQGIAFLGSLPIDQSIAMACDQGFSIRDALSLSIEPLDSICGRIISIINKPR